MKNCLVWWREVVCLGFLFNVLLLCTAVWANNFHYRAFHTHLTWLNLSKLANRSYNELCQTPLVNRDKTSPACNNFKYLQKYGWKGENLPTARAIAVGTTGLSMQIAETHWQRLNVGKQAFEANTNLQSQVHLLIRLWERQTVINISRAQFTHQPCWYSCVCQNKWMSRQSSWVEWNPKSAVWTSS